MKVRDTNHVADVHDLCPPTFPVHCNWLNSNGFVADLSRTLSQTSRHVEMVCVRDFHDLRPRLSPRGSFGESRHNGIWALANHRSTVFIA